MCGYYEKQVTDIIDGKNKMKNGKTEIERARKLFNVSPYSAAKFLKNNGWSIEASMYILLGK